MFYAGAEGDDDEDCDYKDLLPMTADNGINFSLKNPNYEYHLPPTIACSCPIKYQVCFL